ncbi:MAG TPA: DUF177 domain-containing protein [Terriglobales bacterium]|nr:DUF177 domain-containing protein [Terriglobales bacterium]
MFISLHELQLHHNLIEFDQEWQPEAIDFGPDVRQASPLKSAGRAMLVEEHHSRRGAIEDILLVGEFSTGLEILCARCLEPVERDVKKSFDLLYRPQGSDAGEPEIALSSPAEADVGYYRGDGLLLEDVLREQILLTVPLKVVCSEQCKGLCPQCGQNLNSGSCQCEPQVEPRWPALKDIRDKLQK